MHPELFELKALVAGRLDAHRRREIDDHLGSCADCSRHYVAMMLGSSSPKTAEAEAREALVPTGGGAVLTLIAGGASAAPAYGIDAPIIPSASPRPAAPRAPHNNMIALETEFPPSAARTQVPVSASLVDAISKLRAESEHPTAAAAPAVVDVIAAPAPEPVAKLAPEIIAPVAATPLIAPSIFTPTPYDGVSLINPPVPAAAPRTPPAPELVVTFSSPPPRTSTQRASAAAAPASVPTAAITPSQEYVSQAVPTLASVPASEFELTTPSAPVRSQPKPAMLGGVIAAAALVLGLAGYKYFQSSVSQAANAAAVAAAKQVEAAARTNTPAAAPAPAPVQTRIVYVEKPSSRKSEPVAQAKPETVTVAPSVPIAVTLPDVNLNTGGDPVVQSSTQRSAATELTRSARATAVRTAAPRP